MRDYARLLDAPFDGGAPGFSSRASGFRGAPELLAQFVEELLGSGTRFLLLVGYSPYSTEYKGYNIFWVAVRNMPLDFREEVAVFVEGSRPTFSIDISISRAADVPELVCSALHARAVVLVFPSRYKGFSMPLIEAAAP